MNKYTKPEIEILDFAELDVIATSSGEEVEHTPEKLNGDRPRQVPEK